MGWSHGSGEVEDHNELDRRGCTEGCRGNLRAWSQESRVQHTIGTRLGRPRRRADSRPSGLARFGAPDLFGGHRRMAHIVSAPSRLGRCERPRLRRVSAPRGPRNPRLRDVAWAGVPRTAPAALSRAQVRPWVVALPRSRGFLASAVVASADSPPRRAPGLRESFVFRHRLTCEVHAERIPIVAFGMARGTSTRGVVDGRRPNAPMELPAVGEGEVRWS